MGLKSLKYCKVCRDELTPVNSIYSGIHRYNSCRKCHNIKHKARKRETNFISNYGITQKQYDELNELYQGGCGICRKPCNRFERLSVDHDHKTGQVRGLLCQNCNVALGMLKEDEDLI